jgi:DNA polymerase III subunit epsilon
LNVTAPPKDPLNFICIDFETANSNKNSACEIGIIICHGLEVIESIHFRIRPPTPQFDFHNSKTHGISWADVKNEATFLQVWPKIKALLDKASFFAAHNASFDKSVLKACCAYYEVSMPDSPWVCTLRHIAPKFWPKPKFVPNHQLSTLCRYLGIRLSHHAALSDANAVAQMIFIAKEKGWQPELLKANRATLSMDSPTS